jgi:alkylated DNA repair protein (DNA oxidative demethylase)
VDGAVHLPACLNLAAQRELAAACLALGSADAGFYVPVVRGKYPMSVRMVCLGRHWNAVTYKYSDRREDVDGRPAPSLPPSFIALATAAAARAQFAAFAPDICIVNWYDAGSRMGLHQDKDESAASIAAGAPVVSISLGDTGLFRLGGLKRRDPIETLRLDSGDAFVFGGPSRLRYHGVSKILAGTGPAGLGFIGRLNLTFRQF